MKKLIMTCLLVTLLLTTIAFGESEDIIIEIPQFTITVNGEVIDTEHSDFPVITYKGITYFPMTSDFLSNMGLDLFFDEEKGIYIKSVEVENITQLEQNFLSANNVLGSKDTAVLLPFDLYVNGEKIDNTTEEYPILFYKNITYFPMTWRFTKEAFNWDTNWSNEDGYSIVSIDMVKEEDIQLRNVLSKTEDGLTMDDIRFDFEVDKDVLGEWICVDFLKNPVNFRSFRQSWKGDLHYKKRVFFKDGNSSVQLSNGFPGHDKWTNGLILDDNSGMWTASRYFIVEAFNDEFLFVEHKSGSYSLADTEPSYYVYKRGIKEDPNTIGHIDLNLKEIESKTVDGIKKDISSFPFIEDPNIIGKWECVDFVKTPYEFNVTKRKKKGTLWLNTYEFLEKGKAIVTFNKNSEAKEKWTNGVVIGDNGDARTLSRYLITTIQDNDYIFIEFKGGDYTQRQENPNFYVFKRIQEESIEKE